jgi:hypothetical protein
MRRKKEKEANRAIKLATCKTRGYKPGKTYREVKKCNGSE